MKNFVLVPFFLLLAYSNFPAAWADGNGSPGGLAGMPQGGAAQREYTVKVLTRIADPVLNALSKGKLHATMPMKNRAQFACLEAFGRLTAGMAPWLELGPDDTPEGTLRARYLDLTLKSIHQAVDPKGADFMNFHDGSQTLVDTAFLALGLLRAPHQLWDKMSPEDQKNMIAALESSRATKLPTTNNWTLFPAVIEAALWKFSGRYDKVRLETGIEKHLAWYLGDGVYGDGPDFHFDYYNSYVIQPMFLQVLQVCADEKDPAGANLPLILQRARRYAEIQERMISPEGTYPVIGRSSTYRFGAFQELSNMALLHQLPSPVPPASVRCGLTAVIYRTMENPGPFDSAGWLQIGVIGSQPSIAESYISTGSPYLCATGLLHLGLPASDLFWTAPDAPWTQQRIWSGQDIAADHSLKGAKTTTRPDAKSDESASPAETEPSP